MDTARIWLQNLRNEKGYSMKQMGEMLDISESYYSLIESSQRQRKMDISLASKLSSIFDITIGDITEFESVGFASEAQP